MNEAQVKAGLLRYLDEFFHNSEEFLAVEEVPLNQGRTRADLVVIGPRLLGFEIKSPLDDLSSTTATGRLPARLRRGDFSHWPQASDRRARSNTGVVWHLAGQPSGWRSFGGAFSGGSAEFAERPLSTRPVALARRGPEGLRKARIRLRSALQASTRHLGAVGRATPRRATGV